MPPSQTAGSISDPSCIRSVSYTHLSGRGELHLSVLIENMRREGYEFAVSKAEVLYHYDEKGHKLEPMEQVYIDVCLLYTSSLVVYRIPIFVASGSTSRIIFSCASTGSVSAVPVMLPSGVLSSFAIPALTGSDTACLLYTSCDRTPPAIIQDNRMSAKGTRYCIERPKTFRYPYYIVPRMRRQR